MVREDGKVEVQCVVSRSQAFAPKEAEADDETLRLLPLEATRRLSAALNARRR